MANKHDIIWLDTVDSTNSEAHRRIATIDNLSVLSAVHQTAGRGQRGNSWNTAPGDNLTFSIVLKFDQQYATKIQAYDQFSISQMNALAILDFLSSHDIEAKIKWPNDIYVGNKKISGTLIENSLYREWLSWSIIGNGINVNQTTFPDTLLNPTSMSLITGEKYDMKILLEEFMDIFDSYRSRYLNVNGGLGRLRKLYLAQMWRLNEESEFVDLTVCPGGSLDSPLKPVKEANELPGRPFRGMAKGISDTGALIVEDTNGETKEFGFKQIAWVL